MSTPKFIAMAVLLLALAAVLPAAAQSNTKQPIPDVTHNTWTSGAPMPTALNWPTTGLIKGKIYVVGGYTGGPATTTTRFITR